MDFEKSLQRLNQIIDEMNKNNPDLDKVMKLYEEGTKLINSCNEQLDKAEQKVMILQGEKEAVFDEN